MNKQSKKAADSNNKNKKRWNGSKAKSERCTETSKDMDSKVSHFNDPSWYATTSTLLNSAANISFPVFSGKRVELDPDYIYPQNFLGKSYPLNDPIVGGMVLKYHTLPGICVTGTDAINVAARNIYQYVRHANSGHANYDPQDYMIYLLAMDSLYAYYAWMVRIYGIAQSYSLTNRYIPKAMLEAMNVDCDDVQKNGNDFLYAINNAGRKINSLAVPSGMSYYARHIWLNSHVWADDNTSKAQFYIYEPSGFYKFEEVAQRTGGKLTYIRMPTLLGNSETKWTVSNIITGFNTLFDAIINSEDCGIMMGDTLKAFGTNIAQVAPVDTNYQVYAEYNEEVLSQIHNVETTGIVLGDDITQDPNTNLLICTPTCGGSTLGTIRHLLDCKAEVPSSDMVMIATRLKPVVEGAKENAKIEACGSEVVEQVATFGYTYDKEGNATLQSDTFNLSAVLSPGSSGLSIATLAASITMRCSALTKLDWHPYYFLFFKDDTVDPPTTYSGGILGDCFNATPLDDATLMKMHDLAILSMFNVPSMGEFAISK